MSTPAASPRLPWILGAVFLFALFMGAGPGIHLVNPDPTAAGPAPRLFGMPILYAWGVFWYFVQATTIYLAYRLIWKNEAD